MYWSKYNILHKSKQHGYLLYNTMSQVFLRIPDSDVNLWKELKTNPDSYSKLSNGEFLLKSRIIVPNLEEDLNQYITEVLKNKYNPADVALTILPTRGCNFGCIYCYEIDRPNVKMDEETEAGIIRFLKSNSNMKRLSVIWYGGEPLVNFPSIERLSNAFLGMGIEYTAHIVTNGYLLLPSIADQFAQLHIEKAQITLDGTEQIHNARRPLLGGGATYRKIIDNLKYLLSVNPTIQVDIRTNIDRRNMQDYKDFLSEFRSEIKDKRVRTYPGFVSDVLSNECVDQAYVMCEGNSKAGYILDLHKKGINIEAYLPQYRIPTCVAAKYFGFVIGPEGEVYKCWRSVGNQDHIVGNVNDGHFNMYKYSGFINDGDFTRDANCLNCGAIAICGGGCPIIRIRNKRENTSISSCCPEKNHMEVFMEMRYEEYLAAQQ